MRTTFDIKDFLSLLACGGQRERERMMRIFRWDVLTCAYLETPKMVDMVKCNASKFEKWKMNYGIPKICVNILGVYL